MWEVVVSVAQSSVLHWAVLIAAAAAFTFKVFGSTEDLLMGDFYGDEFDG